MNIAIHVFSAFLFLFLLMGALWLFQKQKGEADIVDVGWTLGLGIVSIFYACCSLGDPTRRLLLALFTGVWSIRLATYLLFNRVFKPGEDTRYKDLRKKWGDKAQRNFFIFFQAQAISVVILSIPFLVAANNPQPTMQIWDYLAVVIFCSSIIGESIADRQLAKFRSNSNNHGKTCRLGMWKYSRHPNYFFEWIHWWSYVLLAVGSNFFFLTLIGPVIMFILIVKITGIPPIEKRALQSRPEDYKDYQAKTSAFVPWFPKK